MVVIGGFRSDLLVTPKTDGKFGNVSADLCFVFQSRVSMKTGVNSLKKFPSNLHQNTRKASSSYQSTN